MSATSHRAEPRTYSPEQNDAAARDTARVRAELRVRMDRWGVDFEAALRWLANENPDAVNEALDEIGAPS